MAIEARESADRPNWPRPEMLDPLDVRPYAVFIRNTPRPLLDYRLARFPAGSMTEPHSHPGVSIHACVQGTLTIVTPREVIELSAGMVCLLPRGARHQSCNHGERNATVMNLLVDTRHPGHWPRESGVTECCRELHRLVRRFETFNTAADTELARVFWQMADRVSNDGPCNTAATVGFLWALLGRIVELLNGAAADLPSADAARRARRFLAARVHDQITVSQVARAVQMSPPRLQQVFRSAYGCGIMHYFNQLKVKQAQRLLADSALTVDQVSRKLSFSSPTYFSRVFLRYTGQTPRDFRACGEAE